jgi:hypothetical protein
MARSEQELIEKEMMAASGLADSQSQAAAAEEERLVELALKDSVEEAMGGLGGPDPGAWMGDFASGAAAAAAAGGAAAGGTEGGMMAGGQAPPSVGAAVSDIEQLVAMVRAAARTTHSHIHRTHSHVCTHTHESAGPSSWCCGFSFVPIYR